MIPVPSNTRVWLGGTLVRTIGLERAKAKIGMKNLAYNIRRLGQLHRLNPFPT